MSDIVIRVENLSKRYRLGTISSRTLREDIHRTWARLLGKPDPIAKIGHSSNGNAHSLAISPHSPDLIWALRDVSFDVRQGEVLGIIGRNGAGKSTLLKILSRITAPTGGVVKVKGRIASLLEVGTGFHPELTGRENIYLNGTILGMKRGEIARKFEEIVSFAEVERFIDTPVKRYSSGMYVRLAFAVAAHLEPEILIVDEVLAVGDVAFQKKCLGKMEEIGAQGRTILYVSHNMASVTRLCDRVILLEQGLTLKTGDAHQVVSHYLASGLGKTESKEWKDLSHAPGNEIARLRSVRVRNAAGAISPAVDIRTPVAIEIEFQVLRSGHIMVPSFECHNEEGLLVFLALENDPEWRAKPRPVGRYRSTASIPGNFLAEGTVLISPGLGTLEPPRAIFSEPDAVAFQVIDRMEENAARGDYTGYFPGIVRPMLDWKTEIVPESTPEIELYPYARHAEPL